MGWTIDLGQSKRSQPSPTFPAQALYQARAILIFSIPFPPLNSRSQPPVSLTSGLTASMVVITPATGASQANKPIVMLIAGLPETSLCRKLARRYFLQTGTNMVRIDPDEGRLSLPVVRQRMRRGVSRLPQSAYSMSGWLDYGMMMAAAKQGYDLIVDSTLADPRWAMQNVTCLKLLDTEWRYTGPSCRRHSSVSQA